MSLALIQGYSSAEEEEDEERFSVSEDDSGENDENEDVVDRNRSTSQNSLLHFPKSSRDSLLPSALDAFAEVAGPPEFLNNAVEEHASAKDLDLRGRHGGQKVRKEKKDLPHGAIVEAKAQLVGIRDRVRSDVDGNFPPSVILTEKGLAGEGKRVVSAANPDAKDAAELLRMCLHCGVPKSYSNVRGMVCPICGDRPPADPSKGPDKKKGSTIKEKEKIKRMRGQSSHSAWKSETEMQLRQQFD